MIGSRRKPRWVAVPVAFVLGVCVGGSREALQGLLTGEPWNWAVMALYVFAWTLLMPPFWWLIWRAIDRGHMRQHPARKDRALRSKAISRAIAAGALPPDANLDAWRRALRDEVREMSGMRWFAVGFATVVAGLIGAAAIVANGNAWNVWAVAALVSGAGLAAFRWWTRQIGFARRLMTETIIG